jgi:pimeloyl-ACP methyl ester carboxylesterase
MKEENPVAESLAVEKSTDVRTTPLRLRMLRAAFRALGAVAPGLAARLAIRLFRTVRPFPRPEREKRWLAPARRFEIAMSAADLPAGFESRRLAAWAWGDGGPTVLLAHGWEGRGSQMAAFAAPLVARGLRVVAFDAPGHGETGGRLSSLPEFAGAVAAASRQVGPLAAVVAHSFGAAATCYALMRGRIDSGDVPRLVFIAPPGDLHRYVRLTAEMLGLSAEVETAFLGILEERFGVSWAEARHATTRAARETPLLVVHDHDDDETPLPDARRVAAAWPQGRLRATRGLGHRRILRAPEVVAEVVGFLAPDAS